MGAIIGAVLAAGVSAGIGAATAPGTPDYGKASIDGIMADAGTLPYRRMVEALAHLGANASIPDPQNPAKDVIENHTVTAVNKWDKATGKNIVGYIDDKTGETLDAKDVIPDSLQQGKFVRKVTVHQPGGTIGMDFTGMGDADIALANALKMAPGLLNIQKVYGPQFITERLKELQQSNPQEWAARKKMFDEIMAQQGRAPDTRTNQLLSDQLFTELGRGGTLDPTVTREEEQDVRRQQAARGNMVGNAPMFEEAQQIGKAAEERKAARQARALSFLSSGATPEDVAFRRFQQNLSNLGSFVSGQTPLSQFKEISGAQQGAVPFMQPGDQLGPAGDLNPNAGGAGANWAMGMYNSQLNQPNPYLRGIGTGINAYGMLSGMKGGGGGSGGGGGGGGWDPALM